MPFGRDRRGTPADWLVVGLGNPGAEYDGSRHNLGFEVVDVLAARHGARLKKGKERALVDEVRLGGQRVALAKPITYMNLSGESVRPLVQRYGIADPGRLVVVHDELDLEPGRFKIKIGGGLAGHNGLRSITAHLKTQDYVRIRLGVGKPPGGKEHGADHVLRKVSKRDRTEFDVVVQEAADAVEAIVADGAVVAQSRHHR